jgi:hypothetical protein
MTQIPEQIEKRLVNIAVKTTSDQYYSSDEYLQSENKSFPHNCLIGDVFAQFGLKYSCSARARRSRIFCKFHGKHDIFGKEMGLSNFIRNGCYSRFKFNKTNSQELCEYPCGKHRCLSRITVEGKDGIKHFVQCEKSIYNNLLVCKDHICNICLKEYDERFRPSIYTTILCFREKGKIDRNVIKLVLSYCYPKIITRPGRFSEIKSHFYFHFDRYARNLMNCEIYCNCPNGKKLCANFSKSPPPGICCRYTINNEEFCENCKIGLMRAAQKSNLERRVDLFLSKEEKVIEK